MILTHIVPHAADVGISATKAARILSLIAGMTILDRLIMGGVSDCIGKKRTAIICVLIEVGILIWLLLAHDLWTFYLFAVVFGFCYGDYSPPLFSMIDDVFRLCRIGIIMGVLDIGCGAVAAIGPALGGFVFNATQSYSAAFIVAAITLLLIALFTALISRQTIDGSV